MTGPLVKSSGMFQSELTRVKMTDYVSNGIIQGGEVGSLPTHISVGCEIFLWSAELGERAGRQSAQCD